MKDIKLSIDEIKGFLREHNLTFVLTERNTSENIVFVDDKPSLEYFLELVSLFDLKVVNLSYTQITEEDIALLKITKEDLVEYSILEDEKLDAKCIRIIDQSNTLTKQITSMAVGLVIHISLSFPYNGILYEYVLRDIENPLHDRKELIKDLERKLKNSLENLRSDNKRKQREKLNKDRLAVLELVQSLDELYLCTNEVLRSIFTSKLYNSEEFKSKFPDISECYLLSIVNEAWVEYKDKQRISEIKN